jgi:hypothetical protein
MPKALACVRAAPEMGDDALDGAAGGRYHGQPIGPFVLIAEFDG